MRPIVVYDSDDDIFDSPIGSPVSDVPIDFYIDAPPAPINIRWYIPPSEPISEVNPYEYILRCQPSVVVRDISIDGVQDSYSEAYRHALEETRM